MASKAVAGLGYIVSWENYYKERVAKGRFINKSELKILWNSIWVLAAGHLYKPRACPEKKKTKKQGYEGDPEQTITPVYEAEIDL